MEFDDILNGRVGLEDFLVPNHIKEAPDVVRRRIRALKKLQLEAVKIQTDFYRQIHELETELRPRFESINKKRAEIVAGEYEPTDEECDAKIFSWMDEEQAKKFNEGGTPSGDSAPKGIPDFWLNVLKGFSGIGGAISKRDESVLHYLTDITVDQVVEPPSFTLKFHFAENPHLQDAVLTKYYKLSIGPNGLDDDVLYSGPSIVETKGCKINWKEGKDVTVKVEGARDDGSFFEFFSPPAEMLDKETPDDIYDQLEADFEVGHEIRDEIIDGAVLCYTEESGNNYDSDGSSEGDSSSSDGDGDQQMLPAS